MTPGRRLNARVRMALTEPVRVLSISEEIEELLGSPPEDWLASRVSLRDRIHPDDAEPADQLFSSEAFGGSGSCNLRVRHADGRIRCLRGEYRKQRDEAGNRMLLDLILSPVGPEIGAELQSIVACWKSALDSTSDYLYLKDRNGVYLAATRSMSVVTGSSPESFPGKTVYDLYPEPVADRLYRRDREIVHAGQSTHEVERFTFADGSHRWIDNRKYPLRSPSGEVIGIFGICPDITEPLDAEARLSESRELFQLFIEHAPAALAMFDREMRYLAASNRWLEDYGLRSQEIIGRSHYEIFPEIPERWKAAHRRALAGESVHSDEDRFVRADCSVQWLRWEAHPWRTAEGAIGGIVLFTRDITEMKKDKEQLRLAASVFTHAREGILICDPKGAILDVNDTFTRITGYSRTEVLGRNPRLLKSGRQNEEFYRNLWRAVLENGQWSGEIWNKSKDGRIYPEHLTIRAIHDAAGKLRHYIALFTDISELKDRDQRLERIAYFDALTNLPNRTLLDDRLQQAITQAHPRGRTLGVACFDLDGFRSVNERYGRPAGDALLLGMVRRVRGILPEADTLARIGGNKFAAILLDLQDAAAARPLLDDILAAIAEPQPCGEVSASLSASMGVVFYPQAEPIDAGHLVRQAEQALHQAKLAGKNRCQIFDPRHDITIRNAHEDRDRISHALDADELVLYFQPRVNMSTGALTGVEALLRWQHPTRGLLLPAAFLPGIEDHPLIDRVGEWVLDHALGQLESWHAAGLRIPVSVNIAAHHLRQPNFPDRLRAILAAHPGVDPSRLELEVLETSALHDVAQVSHLLAACRDIGVSSALDDFGTGYSSLTYLRRLPITTLKIDQSFVRDMLDNPEDLSILEGVLGLATAFDHITIAEGVETIEHGRLLLQLGCQFGQGFGIAHPMPASEVPAWLLIWKPDPAWTSAVAVPPEKHAMLHAAVAHRAWVSAFESFLRGERRIPPVLDPHRCRFGRWLDRERSASAPTSALSAVYQLHLQIHHFADRFAGSGALQPEAGFEAGVAELHRLRDALLAQIDTLLLDERVATPWPPRPAVSAVPSQTSYGCS